MERRLQPREPLLEEPADRFSIAGLPTQGGETAADQDHHSYPPTYSAGEWGNPGEILTYDAFAAGLASAGYRYRPLTERDKERFQDVCRHEAVLGSRLRPRGVDSDYRVPDRRHRQSFGGDAAGVARSGGRNGYGHESRATAPGGLTHESFTFRPLDEAPGGRGRWRGPYDSPAYRRTIPSPGQIWPTGPLFSEPLSAPSHPEFGSVPPSHRMYPRLQPVPDRRLTAR